MTGSNGPSADAKERTLDDPAQPFSPPNSPIEGWPPYPGGRRQSQRTSISESVRGMSIFRSLSEDVRRAHRVLDDKLTMWKAVQKHSDDADGVHMIIKGPHAP